MDSVTEKVADGVREAAEKVKDVAGKVLGADKPLPLPETREQLLALHDVARRKRDAAPLDSHERVEASFEIERIEIQIARIERSMDPPLV
jgi:hypothetical protein